ncbi:MAG: hypothetical protein QXL17_07180 [Candidatus Thermoplasmatota archaeon]
MTYCASCGATLFPNDEQGICHQCKLAMFFNQDNCPDIQDYAG